MVGVQTAPASGPRVFLETFGCQMNVLDSELVLGELIDEDGYVRTASMDDADLVLFNTCSVRQHAEDKVWSRLGTLKRRKERNPELVVAVMGCMAQKEKENLIRRAPAVDLVVGTHEFSELPRLVREVRVERESVLAVDLEAPIHLERDPSLRRDPYRAYVSVQRGCDMPCTFCVVPYTRGPETYRPIDEVTAEVRRLVDDGVREVTLLGQTIDAYGKRLPGRPDLGDLLEACHEVEDLARIRFITSHPMLMRESILRRVGELPRVCPYVHIPAQSGSNEVLKRMRRGYTVRRYLDVVERTRELIPDAAVAGDIIVGFPGETEEDYEKTVELVERVRYSQLFIFKYSPRPHTTAAETLEDDVPREVKKRRNNHLLDVQEAIQAEAHERRHGETVEVLVEGPSKTDETKLSGRTPRNKIVIFEGPEDLAGELRRIRITESTPLTLFGRRVD